MRRKPLRFRRYRALRQRVQELKQELQSFRHSEEFDSDEFFSWDGKTEYPNARIAVIRHGLIEFVEPNQATILYGPWQSNRGQ